MIYEIYTDGAVSGNGKSNAPGGWAYVILKDGAMIAQDSGGEKGTTNQRMELTAALNACREVENNISIVGKLITVLAFMCGSSAISEIIARIKID